MIQSTNHGMTGQCVFLLNSRLTPKHNYWSYRDETGGKLRQCIQVTHLAQKGAK